MYLPATNRKCCLQIIKAYSEAKNAVFRDYGECDKGFKKKHVRLRPIKKNALQKCFWLRANQRVLRCAQTSLAEVVARNGYMNRTWRPRSSATAS